MISYSELKKGQRVIYKNQPHEIIEAVSMFKGRGHSTTQAKLKNLVTGKIIFENFHPADTFDEADLKKITVKFVYSNQDKFVFSKEDNKRFELTAEQLGSNAKFLKPNQELEGLVFNEEIVNVSLPIKVNLKIDFAPPGVKGDRASGGNKMVTLETGAEIAVPLFVEQGDVIEVNTEKEEYVRRVK
jgi:elongation factor P